MSTEINTNTITTPEPETPQVDPAAPAARESAVDAAPVTLPVQPEGPHPVDMVLSPSETESVYRAYQEIGLIETPDPLDALRADMMEEIDVLADALSTLTCHLIDTQIAAYRERRRALLTARDAIHEAIQLRADVAVVSKVKVSTVQQWQKDLQALKDQVQLEKATADALREENVRLQTELHNERAAIQMAAEAAGKVLVSTLVTLPAGVGTMPAEPSAATAKEDK